ncbi:hypothetical protein BaRGS_00005289 [Batillaria attramentaria]|uniref:Uncharacterized protein n=1 Tax=Batillaria attramentaria TaxID=370345 RepID=A0ABD0LVZ2_9CAEN
MRRMSCSYRMNQQFLYHLPHSPSANLRNLFQAGVITCLAKLIEQEPGLSLIRDAWPLLQHLRWVPSGRKNGIVVDVLSLVHTLAIIFD